MDATPRKRIGFLSFGHWQRVPGSQTPSAAEALAPIADTILLTVPNQLGVEYNARLLETIAREIAPAIGWRPSATAEPAA